MNSVTAGSVEDSVDNQLTYSTELQTAQVGSPLFWNYVTGSSVLYTFNGADSYGDGWNGGSVDIAVDGVTVVSGFTFASGSSGSTTFSANPGAVITLTWVGGSYPSEISWTIDDPSGVTLSSGNTATTAGGTVPSSGGPTGTFDNFAFQWDATDRMDIVMLGVLMLQQFLGHGEMVKHLVPVQHSTLLLKFHVVLIKLIPTQ